MTFEPEASINKVWIWNGEIWMTWMQTTDSNCLSCWLYWMPKYLKKSRHLWVTSSGKLAEALLSPWYKASKYFSVCFQCRKFHLGDGILKMPWTSCVTLANCFNSSGLSVFICKMDEYCLFHGQVWWNAGQASQTSQEVAQPLAHGFSSVHHLSFPISAFIFLGNSTWLPGEQGWGVQQNRFFSSEDAHCSESSLPKVLSLHKLNKQRCLWCWSEQRTLCVLTLAIASSILQLLFTSGDKGVGNLNSSECCKIIIYTAKRTDALIF